MACGGNNFKGWIWPRDTRPDQSWKQKRWSCFKDVLTGKGPDIYIGRLDKNPHQPSRQQWSSWGHVFNEIPPDHSCNRVHSLLSADRDDQVYDYRSRKWRDRSSITVGMWSDRRVCQSKHAKVPLAVRDGRGYWSDLRALHLDPTSGEETCWHPFHG